MTESEMLAMIRMLLERPISYNPAFRLITKHTGAALFLTQAWYWSNRVTRADGYFYRTIAEWELETGLTRDEQDTCKAILKKHGILETKVKGVPPVTHFKINQPRVLELLQFAVKTQIEFVEFQQNRLRRIHKTISGKAAKLNESGNTTGNTQGGGRPSARDEMLDQFMEN